MTMPPDPDAPGWPPAGSPVPPPGGWGQGAPPPPPPPPGYPPGAPGAYPAPPPPAPAPWGGGPPTRPPTPGYPQPPYGGYQPPYGGYQPYAPGYGVGPGFNFASGGQRIGARLIDGLLSFGLAMIFFFVFFVGLTTSSRTDTLDGTSGVTFGSTFGIGAIIVFWVLALALGFLNEIALVAWKGGSLGKLALGIRIVKQDGSPADWGTAFMRYVPNLAGLIPLCGGLVSIGILIANLVMVLGQPPRQDVYDKVAKTFVVIK